MAKPINVDPPTPKPTPQNPPSGPGQPGAPGTPPTGPNDTPTLPGPIGTRWRQLGGEAWGRLDPDVPGILSMNDGRGRWAQFVARNLTLRVIVWTQKTGAFAIMPGFNEAWVRAGRHQGPLGYPTSEELVAHDGVGRYQTFEGGVLVWHPDTGVHEVHGAIQAAYLQRGGSRFGYPTTDETGTSDGRGRFNHFYDPPAGSSKSIYWTSETGAWATEGLIRGHWSILDWERSVLGYPTTDEMVAHDGVGRFQSFEGGMIVWHPETGAHEVHGNILTRYLELGGSRFGYPITDEAAMGDGRGRFNHFKELPGGAVKGIHWTSSTGAHEVHGLIGARWDALGFVRSYLRYPTSGEKPWRVEPGGLRQSFEGGQILYSPSRNQTYAQRTTTDPVASVCPHRFALRSGLTLPYCTNRSLDRPDPKVRRAVVVVHGLGRNGPGYYQLVVDAAMAAGVAGETIVVAPHFVTEEDINEHAPGNDVPFWSNNGWQRGDASLSSPANPRPATLSSFEVADLVTARLTDPAFFPNLRLLVVAGHSAGGQFVNRYAAAHQADIATIYIVANPSSYMYLSDERRVPGSDNAFSNLLPTGPLKSGCPGYNNYKYGLNALNPYMQAVGAQALLTRYGRQRVVYLLGTADTDPKDPDLDTGCEASLQGRHRFERGSVFYKYLQYRYGPSVLDCHTLAPVAGVGHSAGSMFKSPEGMQELFPGLPVSKAA